MSDHKLEISQITMQTEGGGIVHAEDEAFATEKVVYYAQVSNDTDQFLGPIEVRFLIDGQDVGWGGMSHIGIGPGESEWFQGSTDTLSVGQHTLHIEVEPGDTLFEGGEQTITLNVLAPKSRRAMDEGEESGDTGWKQRQVYLWIEDYTGAPMASGEAYIVFNGPGGETAERGEVVDGRLTLDNRWTPTGGQIHLTVVSDGRTLTGGTNLSDIDEGDDTVQKSFSQAKAINKMTARTAREAAAKVGITGSYGVDFKVFSAGVEVSTEYSESVTHEEGVEYEVWVPKNILEHAGDDTAAARDR
ncbi:MAG: hypothetical protein ACRD0A_06645 [Acidimicrobiales bacterium]